MFRDIDSYFRYLDYWAFGFALTILFQELVKRTDPGDKDYSDLSQALELIKKSATHINEAVKRMDRSRKVRAVQEKFIAGTTFVSPSRQFIKVISLPRGNNVFHAFFSPGRPCSQIVRRKQI